MNITWVIEGHFLQAITLLLVIVLFITLFIWLVRSPRPQPQKAKDQPDATEHRKYSDDDFIGLD